jgi:ABC-type Fe3+-hydroxamate transport system substrate-binding protein
MKKFLFVAICAALLIAGCGGSADEEAAEKSIEKATGGEAKVEISDKGVKVEDKTGEGKFTFTAGEETQVPEDFPDDVLIYRPSETVTAITVPEGYSVTLATEDESAQVADTYKQEMAEAGWSEEGSVTRAGSVMLIYKKDGRTASISIVPSDDMTQIILSVQSD